ncbi:MAG: DUF3574 domain-containing protein [Erysipelotrichaceae bacterium]|nr:DUF3574 domain-containing protein [Erysipelotrichaceae bacterium]
MERQKQANIYIGLNDGDTKKQKYDIERYRNVLKDVCKAYHCAFSLYLADGGYFHDDGTFVEEKTLVVMLLGTPEETVKEIAKDLCAFFNQESVMITYDTAEVHFIRESIDI